MAHLVQAVRRPVAVLCDREALAFAAFLGVLQSGNCYVPLEAKMPQQRLEAILGQLQPAALLYLEKEEVTAQAYAESVPLLCLEQAVHEMEEASLLEACRAQVLDVDPAYLIYTSGSTGMPKGIVISHRRSSTSQNGSYRAVRSARRTFWPIRPPFTLTHRSKICIRR